MAQPFTRRRFISEALASGMSTDEVEDFADHAGVIYAEVERLLQRHDGSLRNLSEEGLTTIFQALTQVGHGRDPRVPSLETVRRDVAAAMLDVLGQSSSHEYGENERMLHSALVAEVAIADAKAADADEGESDVSQIDLYENSDNSDDQRIAQTARDVEDAQIIAQVEGD